MYLSFADDYGKFDVLLLHLKGKIKVLISVETKS